MSLSTDKDFKDALEQFCAEWQIDYAVILVPNNKDITLLGVNMGPPQIKALLDTVVKNMPDPKRRLDS